MCLHALALSFLFAPAPTGTAVSYTLSLHDALPILCKAYAGEMALDVCAKCLELLGPVGLDGHIVEKLYRDVKVFRSEEHTSELQSVSISYAVFCFKNKKNEQRQTAYSPIPHHHTLL